MARIKSPEASLMIDLVPFFLSPADPKCRTSTKAHDRIFLSTGWGPHRNRPPPHNARNGVWLQRYWRRVSLRKVHVTLDTLVASIIFFFPFSFFWIFYFSSIHHFFFFFLSIIENFLYRSNVVFCALTNDYDPFRWKSLLSKVFFKVGVNDVL